MFKSDLRVSYCNGSRYQNSYSKPIVYKYSHITYDYGPDFATYKLIQDRLTQAGTTPDKRRSSKHNTKFLCNTRSNSCPSYLDFT